MTPENKGCFPSWNFARLRDVARAMFTWNLVKAGGKSAACDFLIEKSKVQPRLQRFQSLLFRSWADLFEVHLTSNIQRHRRLTWGKERWSCVRLRQSSGRKRFSVLKVPQLVIQSGSVPFFKMSLWLHKCGRKALCTEQSWISWEIAAHLLQWAGKKRNKKTGGLKHLRVTALAHCGIYEDILPDLV